METILIIIALFAAFLGLLTEFNTQSKIEILIDERNELERENLELTARLNQLKIDMEV